MVHGRDAIRIAVRQLSQTWKLRHYDVIDDAIINSESIRDRQKRRPPRAMKFSALSNGENRIALYNNFCKTGMAWLTTPPGVGRMSCVTGHKTSAVSRPCISKTITWRSLKSRNNRKTASKTSHSTASGSVSASKRHDQISSENG